MARPPGPSEPWRADGILARGILARFAFLRFQGFQLPDAQEAILCRRAVCLVCLFVPLMDFATFIIMAKGQGHFLHLILMKL